MNEKEEEREIETENNKKESARVKRASKLYGKLSSVIGIQKETD